MISLMFLPNGRCARGLARQWGHSFCGSSRCSLTSFHLSLFRYHKHISKAPKPLCAENSCDESTSGFGAPEEGSLAPSVALSVGV